MPFLKDRLIKLKHDLGRIDQGEEAKIINQDSLDRFFIMTEDGRVQFANRNDFILIDCFTPRENCCRENNSKLSDRIINYLVKKGFKVLGDWLIQDDTTKIIISNGTLEVHEWKDSIDHCAKWYKTFSLTGFERLDLGSFKLLMQALGLVGKESRGASCVEDVSKSHY